jgi:hypothetical protein
MYNRPEVADVPSGPSMDSTPHYANFCKHYTMNAYGGVDV